MDSKDIDKLIEDYYYMINNLNMSDITKFFKKYGERIPENFSQEEIDKSLPDVMMNIENGDYSYFFDKIIKGNHNKLIESFMIFSSKKEDIKRLILEGQRLNIDNKTICNLIKATEDSEYIKTCVEKREEIGLSYEQMVNLIKEINDPQYIKTCVEKLCLDSRDKKDLIIATKDQEYIKTCVEKRDKLNFSSYDITELIIATKDPEYIKTCIEKREELELCWYEDWGSGPCDWSNVIKLIIATNDPKYIKTYVEKREELGLTSKDIMKLIKSINDPEYITSCIIDRENLGLTLDMVKNIILSSGDSEYIKSCIDNRENLGLTSTIVTDMILATGELKNIEEAEGLELEQKDLDRLRKFTQETDVNLPPEMTIGVEIESEGEISRSVIIESLRHNKLDWEAKGDGSLEKGTEVVSPILTGDNKKSSNEIRSVCAILNGVGQTISERCGGHIHIGADYLTNKQDWVNLIKIWGNAEKLLYIISNEEGDIPREGVPEYASPISKKFEDALETGRINLDTEEDLEDFASSVSTIQENRCSCINFLNVGANAKNTIEFRLPNGTINPNTWIENINLFGGIVRASHELTAIQKKPENQRTDSERKMLESFEKLQTEQDDAQILDSLLELTISPENRQIYIDRYAVNNPLLKQSPEVEEAIISQISTNKIGKKVFTGKDVINGTDYQQGTALIEQMLTRDERQESVPREE